MTQEAKSENSATAWSRPARIIVTVIFVLTPFIVLWLTRPFWSWLAVAAILAALLRPVAAFLQRRLRFSRALALAATILLLAVIVIGFLLLLPVLISGLASIADKLSALLTDLATNLADTLSELTAVEIGGATVDLSPLAEPIYAWLDSAAVDTPEEALDELTRRLARLLEAVVSTISLISTTMFTVFFTIYLITDVSWITDGVDRLIPEAHRHEWAILFRRLVRVWTTYIFGQLGVMAAVGAMITVVAWLIGLPHPLALGFLAGVLEIIPTMGPVLAAIPAVLLALFMGSTRFVDMPNVLFALLTALSYYGVVLIDDNLVTPNIHGHILDLPPLVVLLGVLVGVHQFGLIGGILALPVLVSLRELYIYMHAKVQGLDPFPEAEAET